MTYLLFLSMEHYKELETYSKLDKSTLISNFLIHFDTNEDYCFAQIEREDYCILLLKIESANSKSEIIFRMIELARMQDALFDKNFAEIKDDAKRYGLFIR